MRLRELIRYCQGFSLILARRQTTNMTNRWFIQRKKQLVELSGITFHSPNIARRPPVVAN
jgi:hypothetical protein